MTIEEFQKIVLEINKQFMDFQAKCEEFTLSGIKDHYKSQVQSNMELLDANLDNAMFSLTEKQRDEISLLLKYQVKNLRKSLLNHCSAEYRDLISKVQQERQQEQQRKQHPYTQINNDEPLDIR